MNTVILNKKNLELDTEYLVLEKINYIHKNPVEAGLIFGPEDYMYSTAVDNSDEKRNLKNVVVCK